MRSYYAFLPAPFASAIIDKKLLFWLSGHMSGSASQIFLISSGHLADGVQEDGVTSTTIYTSLLQSNFTAVMAWRELYVTNDLLPTLNPASTLLAPNTLASPVHPCSNRAELASASAITQSSW